MRIVIAQVYILLLTVVNYGLSLEESQACWEWTEWMSDETAGEGVDPNGMGEFEILNILRGQYAFCAEPGAIECALADDTSTPYDAANQNGVTCSLNPGLTCFHGDQDNGVKCADYAIRVSCPVTCVPDVVTTEEPTEPTQSTPSNDSDSELSTNQGFGMLGVNCDGYLVRRRHFSRKWHTVEDSCCVKAVALLPDTTLLGVGEDGKLYTKRSPKVGKWKGPIEDDQDVTDVAVLPDGRIVGVTPKKKMVVRDNLTSPWERVPRSTGCVSVDARPDGRIIGVTPRGVVKERHGVEGEWTRISGRRSVDVVDIAIQPDGTIFGVGSEDKGIHVLQENGKWGCMMKRSQCVKSVVSRLNLEGHYKCHKD